MGAESTLNFPASQLLAALERAVGTDAPASAWLAALADRNGPLLESAAADLQVGESTSAVDRSRASEPALTRSAVAGFAVEQAVGAGRPVATPRDIAVALLMHVTPPEPELAEAVPPAAGSTEPVDVPASQEQSASPPAPDGRVQTFRVFVSSTFSDFVAERDALRERVWPRLRDYCASHGARFQEVDLRWGVSEEAAVDQQTMNICLEEVERCHAASPRPNFLVLVGNRYGWLPSPPQIPVSEWDTIIERLDDDRALLEQWYQRDDNATPPEYRLLARTGEFVDSQAWAKTEARLHELLAKAVGGLDLEERRRAVYLASATEQEMIPGAFGAERADQVVCFFREIVGHPDVASSDPNAPVRAYVDPDQHPLTAVKKRLRERLGTKRVLRAKVPWEGDGPRLEGYVTRFADRVYAALKATIEEELEHPLPRPADPGLDDTFLDAEGRAHRAFAEQRMAFFTGRTDEVTRARSYLRSGASRPLVLHGEGGTGKSALIAAIARAAVAETDDGTSRIVVARYVGATPASSDGHALLDSICRELARRAGEAETAVPGDYADLVVDFEKRLAAATTERPIVVIVDSLDQLSVAGSARDLSWIPAQLPRDARLIVSTRPGDTLSPLQNRAESLEVRGLPASDGAALLGSWLAHARRTLLPDQQEHVLAMFQQSQGNPLYLRLAFEEARQWTSAGGQPPQALAAGLQDLIRANLFRRLEREDQHGKVLVAHALGYLAASRYGLAEDELVDLLSRDVDVYAWFLGHAFHVPPDLRDLAPKERIEQLRSGAANRDELRAFLGEVLTRADGPRLPAAVWSRLLSDLEPYLALRRSEGGDLLAFHHRELDDVAKAVYASGAAGHVLHSRLADYFCAKADPCGNRCWTNTDGRVDVRGLSELPHHLTEAERWSDLEDVLTDFAFLEQKASRVGVSVRGEAGEETVYTGIFQLQDDFDEALQHLPGGDRGTATRPLIVTAVDFGDGLVVRCPHCNTVHPFREQWRGRTIACPNPECAGPLKLNPFVVEPSTA